MSCRITFSSFPCPLFFFFSSSLPLSPSFRPSFLLSHQHAVHVIFFVCLSCRHAGNVDINVFTFTDFGKNFPKSFKLSPDGFIQNAITLTYHRYNLWALHSYMFIHTNV